MLLKNEMRPQATEHPIRILPACAKPPRFQNESGHAALPSNCSVNFSETSHNNAGSLWMGLQNGEIDLAGVNQMLAGLGLEPDTASLEMLVVEKAK